MNFASDNTGPVHPRIMEALARANEGYAPSYGTDPLTRGVQDKVREIFEAPDAAVHLVSLGTAANALLLATMTRPWDTIFCADVAHIQEDECNSPEALTGGAKLSLVPTTDGRMDPIALRARIEAEGTRGVHGAQRGPVSLTQVTEKGTLYALDALAACAGVAREHGLAVHLDGSRFANAVAALGCTPADMSWKAGVTAVSFGGTKNGCMAVEAAILFDTELSWEFELRRKRAAHLISKHRFLAAQMAAYLEDGLWIDLATAANASARRLADGLGSMDHARLLHPVEANMLFVALPRAAHRRAVEAGAQYNLTLDDLAGGAEDDPIAVRLVTNWATTEAEVDRFLDCVS